MKEKMKRLTKKISLKYLFAVIVIIILLALIITYVTPQKKYSFEEVFYEIKALDEKYDTDFKKEDINNVIIDYKNIDPYLKDILTYEEKAIITLIDARTLMLFSEKNYHQAKIYGDRGMVTDKGGFSCSEAGYIINSAYYFNLTWGSGIQAYITLDQLLDVYRDVNKVWDLIGINEEKPAFFYSNLGDIKTEVANNLYVLKNICLVNMSRGLTNTVDPEIYFNLMTDPNLVQEILSNQQANLTAIKQEMDINITYPSKK